MHQRRFNGASGTFVHRRCLTRMAFQTSTNGVTAQINMTPMIDVLLVLLILFMVIAPTHSAGLPAEIPLSASDSAPVEPSIVLEIAADQSLRINRRPLQTTLATELRRIFQSRSNRTLFIKGDESLTYSVVAASLDTARGAGVDRIALITGK